MRERRAWPSRLNSSTRLLEAGLSETNLRIIQWLEVTMWIAMRRRAYQHKVMFEEVVCKHPAKSNWQCVHTILLEFNATNLVDGLLCRKVPTRSSVSSLGIASMCLNTNNQFGSHPPMEPENLRSDRSCTLKTMTRTETRQAPGVGRARLRAEVWARH